MGVDCKAESKLIQELNYIAGLGQLYLIIYPNFLSIKLATWIDERVYNGVLKLLRWV